MANTITTEEIIKINELYAKLKSYAAVARETGRAPSTIKKYVDKDYEPEYMRNIIKFDLNKDMPQKFDTSAFLNIENFGELCELSDKEKEDMKVLWKELNV